jgi:hypothetical protein
VPEKGERPLSAEIGGGLIVALGRSVVIEGVVGGRKQA